MMPMQAPAPRRDAAYFALGPGLATLICATLWRIHPWPVPIPAQAAIFDWRLLVPSLALGLLGVWLSSRIGCPSAPPLGDWRRWAQIVLWSGAIGAALGVEGLVQSLVPWVARQQGVLAADSGQPNIASWVNVGLPWSIPHYFAASVVLECIYRLAPIPILAWLISRLVFRRRWEGVTFWGVAAFASALEPLLWGLGMLRVSLPLATGAFASLSMAETWAINLVEAYGFRRWGWPAVICFRLGYYAAARIFLPYALAPHSVMYPGPH
jgi:hypothetical protein